MENYKNSSEKDKIKLNDNQYGELKKIVLTTKKIKLNGSQYGELQQNQF